MPQLSVILPVRGDDTILRRCVTSLNTQSFRDFEVILADNSYTGYASALQRKLIDYDNIVTVIKNSPAQLRWVQLRDAVNASSGRFVVFLHPSQWLEPDALQVLVETMVSLNADMAEMRTVKCINSVAIKNGTIMPPGVPPDTLLTGNELRQFTQYIGNNSYISTSIYDKIYRRDILIEALAIDFPGDSTCSDILNIHYLRHARSMIFLSYAGLNYNWQADSERYRFSALADAKAAFRLKKLCGQDEKCIVSELHDALYHHAYSLMADSGWTIEATEYFLQQELTDAIWRKTGLTQEAAEIIATVDKRDRWRDLTKALARLLH